MKINAYLKPHCGWSMGVRAIMNKYSLDYNEAYREAFHNDRECESDERVQFLERLWRPA